MRSTITERRPQLRVVDRRPALAPDGCRSDLYDAAGRCRASRQCPRSSGSSRLASTRSSGDSRRRLSARRRGVPFCILPWSPVELNRPVEPCSSCCISCCAGTRGRSPGERTPSSDGLGPTRRRDVSAPPKRRRHAGSQAHARDRPRLAGNRHGQRCARVAAGDLAGRAVQALEAAVAVVGVRPDDRHPSDRCPRGRGRQAGCRADSPLSETA